MWTKWTHALNLENMQSAKNDTRCTRNIATKRRKKVEQSIICKKGVAQTNESAGQYLLQLNASIGTYAQEGD